MKYRDLTAVEYIDHDEMTKVVGGISFGEFFSGRIQATNEGFAHLPGIIASQALTGTTNLGELIQFRSDQFGLPGINGIIAVGNTRGDSIDLPPGLV